MVSVIQMDDRDALAEQLLRKLCDEHGVSPAMVQELMAIEKRHQFQDKRHGIYNELTSVIRAHSSE